MQKETAEKIKKILNVGSFAELETRGVTVLTNVPLCQVQFIGADNLTEIEIKNLRGLANESYHIDNRVTLYYL